MTENLHPAQAFLVTCANAKLPTLASEPVDCLLVISSEQKRCRLMRDIVLVATRPAFGVMIRTKQEAPHVLTYATPPILTGEHYLLEKMDLRA